MENKKTKQETLTICLLLVYLVVLTWIILFKMQFSLKELGYFRSINIIPFHESVIVNGRIEFSEIYDNILIFVPFGIYIDMIKRKWYFVKKAALIAGVSLIYEVLQFTFAIGASDITDIIGNTFGGIVGITIYGVFLKLLKTEFKANKIINIIALIGTILAILLLAFLVLVNN